MDLDELSRELSLSTSAIINTDIVIMEPSERIKRYGIECIGPKGDGIVFGAGEWKTGGEYVQKLIVRNVTTSVKKLKYRLPSTRYFSLAFPEVIVLSPGMFTELDVVFRPVQNLPYDDSIYFKMQEGENSGGFHVPVRAVISKLQVSAPFGIDLGFSPTHQITKKVFQLENFGEIDAPFRWEVPRPFTLTPSRGIIPVGHKQDIEISINPKDASVFASQALCHVGEGVHAIIPEPILGTRLSAIGKYTYIVISDDTVDFGEILTGTPTDTVRKEVLLRNQSVVPAEFQCTRVESDRDEVFFISPMSGVIPALSEITVTVQYSARASGCYSQDEYIFSTPGKCTTSLTCCGLSIAPKVVLHKDGTNFNDVMSGVLDHKGTPHDSINFNDIEIGSLVTRIFYLKNSSDVSTSFYILGDPEGVFQMCPSKGEIPGGMEIPVKMTFTPVKPINYYRRLYVLIHNALPILYDVMGTGYIRAKGEVKEQRPAPMRHAHVQAYRNRCMKGYDLLSPDELDVMYETAKLEDNVDPSVFNLFAKVGLEGTRPMSVALLKNPLTRTGDTTRVAVAPAHEYFIEDTETHCRGITIDQTEVNFGYVPYGTTSTTRTVSITNHTNGKVSIVWYIPKVHLDREDSHGDDQGAMPPMFAFTVDPPMSEIGAKKTVRVSIQFRPFQTNRNYVNDLEVYGFFKNQRTFRLVNDSTMTPPWCLNLKSIGHTFSNGQIPTKVKLIGGSVHNGKLLFPTCYLNDSVFQIIKLKNSSNLSCTFKIRMGFNDDENANADTGIFTAKPSSGEIAGEDFILVCIRFTPTIPNNDRSRNNNKKFIQLMKCIINGAEGGQLLLEGLGSTPQLCCPNLGDSVVSIGSLLPLKPYPSDFFNLNPTCIGLHSCRELKLKNLSRLPLRFYLTLPLFASEVIKIEPSHGFLLGNDVTTIKVTFIPRSQGRFYCKLNVKVFPIGGVPAKVIDGRQAGAVSKVEPLQDFRVKIAGHGTVGAVVFDPPRLATEVILVNTQETRHITLENISDSTVSYELHYRMNFVPETGSTITSSVSTALQPLKNTFQSFDGTAGNHQNVFCERPSGILPARSRTSLPFHFKPNRAGLFDFIVYCKLKTYDESGNESIITNEDSVVKLLASIFHEKRINDSVLPIVENLPLTLAITGRSSFPTMIVQDIRTEYDSLISDITNLWKQFSVPSINYELAQPLSDEQVLFNTSSSPNLKLLPRYHFSFTPNVVGSPRQTVHIQLKNNGYLQTAYHMHMPNEKELDLEQWCDEEELTEERLMHISIIEELKLFVIEPRSVVLQPGESVVLTVSYSHTSLKYNGVHKLPILMKLEQGKQFWLDLIGTTLVDGNIAVPPTPLKATMNNTLVSVNPTPLPSSIAGSIVKSNSIRLMVCAGQDDVCCIKSVPMGLPLNELPMHRIEVINVSAVDVSYEVDISLIKSINKSNYDVELFSILNPVGTVSGRSSIYLEIIFKPLEAKLYEMPLTIKYVPLQFSLDQTKEVKSRRRSVADTRNVLNNTNFLKFIIRAQGYDTRLPIPLLPGEDYIGAVPPNKRLVDVPTMCTVSEDYIEFGIVPVCFTSSRLIVLRSNNYTHDLEFKVDANLSYFQELGLLTILPTNGFISPGGLAVIELQICAALQPSLITDRIKIVVQACMKASNKRGGGSRHDKIKDRLKNTVKVGSTAHSSVIVHGTTARSQYIENVILPSEKTAKLPSTITIPQNTALSKTQSNSSIRAPTNGGMLDESTTMGSGTMQNSRSIASGNTYQTSELGGTSSGHGGGVGNLRGPPETYVVRLNIEVFNPQVVSTLFGKGQDVNLLDSFIAPVKSAFIPMRVVHREVGTNGTVGIGASAGRQSMTAGGGEASKPGSPTDKPSSAATRNKIVLKDRDEEFRYIADTVLSDLFMDILQITETKEQLIAAVTTPAMGLVLPDEDPSVQDGQVAPLVPKGGPVYGVYFQEVLPDIGLTMRLVEEMNHIIKSGDLSDHSNNRNSSLWDNAAIVTPVGFSDMMVNKAVLLFIFEKIFEFPKKGNSYKKISAILESDRNSCFSLRELIPSLPADILTILDKKLVLVVNKRKMKEKHTRRSSITSKPNRRNAKSPATNRKHFNMSLRHESQNFTDQNYEEEEVKGVTSNMQIEKSDAVLRIQNIARGNAARIMAENIKAQKINKKVMMALTQDDFMSICGDVLKNTMYNLMEEALHEEFPVWSDPVKFVVKE